MRKLGAWSVVGFMGIVAVAGCSSSDSGSAASVGLADGCNINSDCTEPLVCAFRRCHAACESSRDCAEGQRCMASDRPYHVCQLPEEQKCAYNSECPSGQLCGTDGQCRDQCAADLDCVSGQVCTAGTCAEPTELDGGRLPIAKADGGAKTDAAAGLPCAYNSECDAPLVCREHKCAYECLATEDCPSGMECGAEHRCAVPASDGGAAGSGGDASSDATAPCTYNSQCDFPLVCRASACAFECLGDGDCSSGATCDTAGDHRCHAPTVDAGGGGAGGASGSGGAGGTAGSGGAGGAAGASGAGGADAAAGCSYNSECAYPLLCRAGVCAFECLGDADCSGGSTCDTAGDHRCHALVPDAGADASVDGSAGSGGAGGTGGAGGFGAFGGAGGADASIDGSGGGAGGDCPALGWTRPCQTCVDGPTGTQTCVAGDGGVPAWGACVGGKGTEVCDGKDNDCDGTVDNGGWACALGQTAACTGSGSCSGQGTKTCVANGSACQWGPCKLGTESCNGVDDDCDGTPDNGPGMQCALGSTPASCTYTNGACSAAGIPSCDSNCHVQCAPATEVCNGLDDDCDGSADVNANLGLECQKGVSAACSVSACSTTFSGTRVCSSGCHWGACVVPDACNDADDNCNGQVDEGDTYKRVLTDTPLSSTSGNQTVLAAYDGTELWVAWTDTSLGSGRMFVGKFDLGGAPLSPIGNIGYPNGLSGYGSNPPRTNLVTIGQDAYVVSTNTSGSELVLVHASGGNASTPPTLTATKVPSQTGGNIASSGMVTDGTNLYLVYHYGSYYCPCANRLLAMTPAGALLWDKDLGDATAKTLATLAYDGTSLHAAWCNTGVTMSHARVTTAGVIDVAAHAVPNTECDGSTQLGMATSDGVLAIAAHTTGTTYEIVPIDASGTPTSGTHAFNYGGGGDNWFVGRAGTPATFALGTAQGVMRLTPTGVLNSTGLEQIGLPGSAGRGVLLYLPGGPIAVGATGSQIVLNRLGCP